MKNIETEDLETYTLREAVATYGQEVIPLWKNAVYTKPYQLESRRYIGCKAKLTDWIFDLIKQETQDVHTFCKHHAAYTFGCSY